MSHELRTPLNAVIGFSEIMKTELLGPIGTETYRGYSHSIHDSAKHLLGIINDILDISSIESGSPRLHEGIHEPEQICQSSSACRRARRPGAGKWWSTSTPTDLLSRRVRSDADNRSAMRQVQPEGRASRSR
jgi:K+-sensing histidine kinase KdpD